MTEYNYIADFYYTMLVLTSSCEPGYEHIQWLFEQEMSCYFTRTWEI